MNTLRHSILSLALLALTWSVAPAPAWAEELGSGDAPFEIKIGEEKGPRVSATLGMLAGMTALAFIPALLIMTTSFARIIIVLGFLRHALSTQQTPPNVILIGMSLFLTLFIMGPIFNRMHKNALSPYLKGEMAPEEAMNRGLKPLREFMGQQTRKKDLALMLELSNAKPPRDLEDVPTTTLIPAFMLSELRTAFQMYWGARRLKAARSCDSSRFSELIACSRSSSRDRPALRRTDRDRR